MKDQLAIFNAGIYYYCSKDLDGTIAKYHCFSCIDTYFIQYCTFYYYIFTVFEHYNFETSKQNQFVNKIQNSSIYYEKKDS